MTRLKQNKNRLESHNKKVSEGWGGYIFIYSHDHIYIYRKLYI